MNLDDQALFAQLDAQQMIAHIDGLPDQLQAAWQLGLNMPLPGWSSVRNVLIAGMGGSAIGADLVASYVQTTSPVPVIVHRDYDLPAWARGPETLVICSSHSGNTEETLSAFDQALERECRVLVVTTGGTLAARAAQHGLPVWQFEHNGQPRAAVGYSFGLLLAALYRLGLVPDPHADVESAVQAMRQQQASLLPSVAVVRNPAKRMAGQLLGRWPVFFAAGPFAPVARRWKGQVSELAKAVGQFEFLPEADHNTLAGLNHPENLLMQVMALFLQAPSNHPRDLLRLDLSRQMMMMQGINTDFIRASGSTMLAHLWTLLHFGDYTCYYLAMAYGEDPTPVDALLALKAEMSNHS